MNSQFIQNIKSLWSDLLENLEYDEDKNEPIDTKTLGILAQRNKMVINVFNAQTNETEYVSPNVKEILGYTEEEALSNSLSNFFGRLASEHMSYTFQTRKIIDDIFRDEKDTNVILLKSTITGLKYNHPNGPMRILIRYFKLNKDEEDFRISKFIFTVQNITHLMKNDFYFIRFVYKNKDNDIKIKLYHSETNEIINHDIISSREMDVINLIAQGKDTDEIAKTLSISRNTVNNHRQRMFDRMGAKDTTALVQLAQLSEII